MRPGKKRNKSGVLMKSYLSNDKYIVHANSQQQEWNHLLHLRWVELEVKANSKTGENWQTYHHQATKRQHNLPSIEKIFTESLFQWLFFLKITLCSRALNFPITEHTKATMNIPPAYKITLLLLTMSYMASRKLKIGVKSWIGCLFMCQYVEWGFR